MRERDRGHTYIFFEKAWASYIYIISNGVKRAEFSHVNKDLEEGIDQSINQSPSEGSQFDGCVDLAILWQMDHGWVVHRNTCSTRCISMFVSENYRKIPEKLSGR